MLKQRESFKLRDHLPYALAAVTPFLINDLIDLVIDSQRAWVFWTYIVTYPIPLTAVVLWLRRFGLTTQELGLNRIPFRRLASETLITTGLGFFVTIGIFRYLKMLLPEGLVFVRPDIDEDMLLLGDMTIGLTLVAVTEELVFRGLLLPIFDRWFSSQDLGAISAGLLFALIHWSQGIPVMFATFFVALVFTWRFRVCESLYPLMSAHYFINFLGPFLNWIRFL